jgi:hypothetical protein
MHGFDKVKMYSSTYPSASFPTPLCGEEKEHFRSDLRHRYSQIHQILRWTSLKKQKKNKTGNTCFIEDANDPTQKK